jgi:DNA-directed RNA polymerase specialized sigma24 family protein
MRQALTRLPASYRDVLERVDLAGASVREVARATARTAGAVHMLRSRALERLRELLR